MLIRSRSRLLWLFVLRFAALIALSIAVLAGVSLARPDAPVSESPVTPLADPRDQTSLA